MSAAVDVLAVLREVGVQLAPDRHTCSCHHVVDALCPARPEPRPGLLPLRGTPDASALAALIDHTILKPEATPSDVRRLCTEAREHRFAAVCVNPVWVRLCSHELAGSDTLVATVAGFPLGASRGDVKANEAAQAIGDGAREVDMVLNVGALKAGDLRLVDLDVRAVADACGALGAVLKVIIEAALLTDQEKVAACAISKLAGATFVKTSTGFGPGGATAADVALMRAAVGDGIGVKAAGGIRDWAAARAMVAAGASRIGTSSGVKILAEAALG
jgi:deoxyribose-phosphate aldolase